MVTNHRPPVLLTSTLSADPEWRLGCSARLQGTGPEVEV